MPHARWCSSVLPGVRVARREHSTSCDSGSALPYLHPRPTVGSDHVHVAGDGSSPGIDTGSGLLPHLAETRRLRGAHDTPFRFSRARRAGGAADAPRADAAGPRTRRFGARRRLRRRDTPNRGQGPLQARPSVDPRRGDVAGRTERRYAGRPLRQSRRASIPGETTPPVVTRASPGIEPLMKRSKDRIGGRPAVPLDQAMSSEKQPATGFGRCRSTQRSSDEIRQPEFPQIQ